MVESTEKRLTPMAMATLVGYTTIFEYFFGSNSFPIIMIGLYAGLFLIFGFLNRYNTYLTLFGEVYTFVGKASLYLFPAFSIMILYLFASTIGNKTQRFGIDLSRTLIVFLLLVFLLWLFIKAANKEMEGNKEKLKNYSGEGENLIYLSLLFDTDIKGDFLTEGLKLKIRELNRKKRLGEGYTISEENKEEIREVDRIVDKCREHGIFVLSCILTVSILSVIISVGFYKIESLNYGIPIYLCITLLLSYIFIWDIVLEIGEESFIELERPDFSYKLFIYGYVFSFFLIAKNPDHIILLIVLLIFSAHYAERIVRYNFLLLRDSLIFKKETLIEEDLLIEHEGYEEEFDYLFNKSPSSKRYNFFQVFTEKTIYWVTRLISKAKDYL